MLSDLIAWWKQQMWELVPASLHPSRLFRQRVLVACVETSDPLTVELSLRGRGGRASLGKYGLNGPELSAALQRLPKTQRESLVLQVAPDLLLERELVLPLAAGQDLRRVVAYEMDRLTPFRADQVFWTCSAERRDTERNQLHVRLTIAPHVLMQPILAALQQAGLVPTRIEGGTAMEPCRAIILGEGRPDRAWRKSRIGAYAGAGCGVLAVIAVALPFVLQASAMAGIDAHVDAMKLQVMEAEKLRKKIASSMTTADTIAVARNQVGTPLHAIALLTDVLPDDTFLTMLTARQRTLTISGRSAAAARLIGAMASHSLIHNPAFTAPVIRDETNGGEMFSIRAELGT